MNKRPFHWQRLVLSLLGVLTIQASWRWAVAHLYTLPHEALAGFVSITTNCFYVIGGIVVFMVTGRIFYEWKMASSQIQNVAGRVSEKIERTFAPKHYDDGEI